MHALFLLQKADKNDKNKFFSNGLCGVTIIVIMERTIISLFEGDLEGILAKTFERIDSNGTSPKAIIYFADFENFEFYTEELYKKYPDCSIIGSTTYVNFTTCGSSHQGLSVMAIFDGIECATGEIHDISTYPMRHVDNIKKAVSELSSTENACCLEFTSAFSNGEEIVLDTFEQGLKETGITLAGGSSGANPGLFMTKVGLNGKVFNNTCVFILIHNLNGKVFIHRGNLFKPTNVILTSTDVDCEQRIVYEYDNEPAADVVAKNLGLSLEQLKKDMLFHPVGRIKGKELFVAGNSRINPDGSIVYLSRIYNQTKVNLLEMANFDSAMLELSTTIRSRLGHPSFAIAIQCNSNSMILEKKRLFDLYTKTLKDNFTNFVGLSGYGEQINNVHLNQTFVTVVFE